MSRGSSPCSPRAQMALQSTVSVPINGSTRSVNSLSGLISTSSRDMSGSIDAVHAIGPTSARAGPRRMSMQDAIDVSKFDMKLYERRRKNTLTLGEAIHEESRESNEQPHLDFSLRYDKDSRVLTVHVIAANELQLLLGNEADSHPSPYCRVQLLPNASEQPALHGKVHKETSAPQFDERFVFEVDSSEIGLKTLLVSVLHDESASHVCIGHVLFSLCNLQFNQSLAFRRALLSGAPKASASVTPCCILFSLAYLVGAERVTATINKVTNLPASKGKVQCKVVVLAPGGSPKKKKTSAMRVVNDTAELQEALTFTVNRKVIQQTKVRIELFQKATFQKARMLGSLELGPDSTGYAYAHWNDMVNCKDSLPRWHQLLSTVEKNNNAEVSPINEQLMTNNF